jgi:hypothetical protein
MLGCASTERLRAFADVMQLTHDGGNDTLPAAIRFPTSQEGMLGEYLVKRGAKVIRGNGIDTGVFVGRARPEETYSGLSTCDNRVDVLELGARLSVGDLPVDGGPWCVAFVSHRLPACTISPPSTKSVVPVT